MREREERRRGGERARAVRHGGRGRKEQQGRTRGRKREETRAKRGGVRGCGSSSRRQTRRKRVSRDKTEKRSIILGTKSTTISRALLLLIYSLGILTSASVKIYEIRKRGLSVGRELFSVLKICGSPNTGYWRDTGVGRRRVIYVVCRTCPTTY
jgi:hypothetical protein